jgi:hypothetical protein
MAKRKTPALRAVPTAVLDPTRPETWPLVLTFAEVCVILRIGERVGYSERQRRAFPVPEITPRIAGRPRYHRDDVLQALKLRSGQVSSAERRKGLSRVG